MSQKIPARGLVLIKKPDLAESVNGIVLLDKTREGWTAGQAIIVAVGLPAFAEWEDEDQEEGVIPVDPRLKPGTWVLTKFRSWVQTDKADEWVVNQSDILAILD
jgi:co-chaperonin GroES (HSP10)